MSRLAVLPPIMVAPNGARLGKTDHPALPLTLTEIVETARACAMAGAGAIHAHTRDADGLHVLDAGLYRELLTEMARQLSDMPVQLTTEAAGRYDPPAQRALLQALLSSPGPLPEGVSVALSEMLADGEHDAARHSYHALAEAGVALQHILYAPDQLRTLADLLGRGIIPAPPPHQRVCVLYVLGRYSSDMQSHPAMLKPFLTAAMQAGLATDWAVCAFGRQETACLAAAQALGGKMRVGFENNLLMADGTLAPDNAARVREIRALSRQARMHR
ncbi:MULTISPECIES: 3-keto-5-aminohexanoate cleavage protein [unclassified Paracoccus (in: a-proteobacteria)]|uniref:3-keto-5-aminohexanoate cleavage protein n=1 Tax=unclassified Paracoccus (in: a-proteobacteria) TaxID=2688777 RepID=UPI0012B38F87|nr:MULTISPECIES: 3-keto-5-aminohexanoate cleavage protein [unclassified Paracoccus (in: a-proteobacteria)]UXU76320.1 3-keto-5-aminohexanoate cleavage protein [Paracoccus sp. SMMA_5]UXU82343.1 3-keto-5-aminohexanoate cleavage protein [Paracoccus sp. SMMA_5_TC]